MMSGSGGAAAGSEHGVGGIHAPSRLTLGGVAQTVPDVVTALCSWLDEASVARLRAVARVLRAPAEHDSLWMAACERYGYDRAPLRPRAMPRNAPWLQVFRTHVLPRREVPLSGCVSVYSQHYYCVISAVAFTKGQVSLHIHERGDMSQGPLQNPRHSRLTGSQDTNVSVHVRVGA
jgi:hypothetical protein